MAVTSEQVAEKLEVLTASKSVADRKAAAAWFVKYATAPPPIRSL